MRWTRRRSRMMGRGVVGTLCRVRPSGHALFLVLHLNLSSVAGRGIVRSGAAQMTTSPRLISIPTCPPFRTSRRSARSGRPGRIDVALPRQAILVPSQSSTSPAPQWKCPSLACFQASPEDNLRYDQVAWMGRIFIGIASLRLGNRWNQPAPAGSGALSLGFQGLSTQLFLSRVRPFPDLSRLYV